MDDVLLRRLAAHRGVAVPDPAGLLEFADAVGWRPADVVAISGLAVPAAMMPVDPRAKPQVRRVLERAGALTPERIEEVRRLARSLAPPARKPAPAPAPEAREPAPEARKTAPPLPAPGSGAPAVTPMTFGAGLWRLLAVRNLDRGTVCRLVAWPESLLGNLMGGHLAPRSAWMPHLGVVLGLRPDDLAALADVEAPADNAPALHIAGLVLDLLPLPATAIAEVAASVPE